MNHSLFIENEIRQAYPTITAGCLLIQVKVHPSPPDLLQFIRQRQEEISRELALDDIHNLSALCATREAYKALGKDPSRYRPSAEALLRRIVQGKGLYQVNNVVDALNIVSASSGFSIGGYDATKIRGVIRLGIGREEEPYEAIGRGRLNIHGLPALRDEIGAFGSPTSDSLRTMVTESTSEFLAVFFDFGKNGELENAMGGLSELLAQFAQGKVLARRSVEV